MNMNKAKSRDYLKSMLSASVPVNIPAALECFRQHYRANTEKLELLLSDTAELTIGRADFTTKCFMINGQSVSTKLDKPTNAAKIRCGLEGRSAMKNDD